MAQIRSLARRSGLVEQDAFDRISSDPVLEAEIDALGDQKRGTGLCRIPVPSHGSSHTPGGRTRPDA